jgi:hypothetical protein
VKSFSPIPVVMCAPLLLAGDVRANAQETRVLRSRPRPRNTLRRIPVPSQLQAIGKSPGPTRMEMQSKVRCRLPKMDQASAVHLRLRAVLPN